MTDPRFALWPGGDTHFVYPVGRNSIRFELPGEEIRDFEKFKMLCAELEKSGQSNEVKQLYDDGIKDFELKNLNGTNSNIALEKARHILNCL